jgi:predicted  nucleic acid-binding Zn-ribbon protein
MSNEVQEIKDIINRQNEFLQSLVNQFRAMQESENSALREVRDDIKSLTKSITELAQSLNGSNNELNLHKALVEQRLVHIEKDTAENIINIATNEKASRALGKSLDDFRAEVRLETDKERAYMKGMLTVGGVVVTVIGAVSGLVLNMLFGG